MSEYAGGTDEKIILDLCGGTGAWSRPYVEAGYDVRVVTMPEQDVRLYQPPDRVHGILASPPCTYFCAMHRCNGNPTTEQLLLGLSVVDACLRIVHTTRSAWWALENPSGDLPKWLGKPRFSFQPSDYGDPWTKKTWLWGVFTLPIFSIAVDPHGKWVGNKKGVPCMADMLAKKTKDSRVKLRSMTPPGFARAFFEANP